MDAHCYSVLGRWASAVVLEYIEEALAEVPDGGARPSHLVGAPSSLNLDNSLAALEDRLQVAEAQLRTFASPRCTEAVAAEAVLLQDKAAEDVRIGSVPTEAFVRNLESGRVHVCASSNPDLPSTFWTTSCGWAFARSSTAWELVEITEALDVAPVLRCGSCKSLRC